MVCIAADAAFDRNADNAGIDSMTARHLHPLAVDGVAVRVHPAKYARRADAAVEDAVDAQAGPPDFFAVVVEVVEGHVVGEPHSGQIRHAMSPLIACSTVTNASVHEERLADGVHAGATDEILLIQQILDGEKRFDVT